MATLHYVTDGKPGITRKKRGRHFQYFAPDGQRISDKEEIKRINALVIPPAYKNVWICPNAHGHLQATGLDARGRKQYRYHPLWRAQREANKFEHILHFGETLPAVRRRVAKDAAQPGMAKYKVLAIVVQLLEKTLIRVGNSEYARANKSYGLTTLLGKHVEVKGQRISFRFTGKSGKIWNLALTDRRIANAIKQCADLPGQELFKYVDDNGAVIDVASQDVNAYIKEISGADFTAKDFRTWSATVLAAMALTEYEQSNSQAQAKKNMLRAIEHVASRLGNTPAICRKSYIHPEVISAYLDGNFVAMVDMEIERELALKFSGLSQEERMVMVLLHRRLHKERQKKGKAS